MYAFLPELEVAVPFMRGFGKMQALQQAFGFLLLEVVDDPACGVGFEASDALVQVRRLGDEMQVIFQNYLTVEF